MKRTPKKSGGMRKPCAIAVLAILAVTVAASFAHAEDAPLLSSKRLTMAAQFGYDWRRPTNEFDGVQTKPAVKLNTSYSLFGQPINPNTGRAPAAGSVALVFPIKLDLNADHQFEAGAYISVIFWAGSD